MCHQRYLTHSVPSTLHKYMMKFTLHLWPRVQWNLFILSSVYNKIACFFFCYKNFSLGDNLIFFCLSRLIFQLPTDLEKNSQLSQVVRKKKKKYLKKEKAIRKWHTIFSFLEFKIAAN